MLRLSIGLAIISGLARAPHAATIFSSLDGVFARSPNVVLAIYNGHLELHVEETLRGKLSGDIVAVAGDGQPNVMPGTRVVAFLDAGNKWNYVGEAASGVTIEDAVIVRGFFDSDASVVTPGLVTLDQLRGRFSGHPITWRFEGPVVALADDGSRVVETPWKLDVSVSEGHAPTVAGSLPTRGLTAPSIGLAAFDPIDLDWQTLHWQTSSRKLVIQGDVIGHRGHVLLVRFHVKQPNLFRMSDLAKYLKSAKAESVLYRMRITWSDGEVLQVTASEDPARLEIRDTHGTIVPWDVFDMQHIGAIDLGAARSGVLLDSDDNWRVLEQELLRGALEVSKGGRTGRLELIGVTISP